MSREYVFYVYILASRSRTLYVGMTNNVVRRHTEHAGGRKGSFTARYKIDRLVYYERHQYVRNAIAREKELKDWSREKKVELIEKVNPTWEDLSTAFSRNYRGEPLV
ncbi:GIY-YIG nuclease family protein [Terriglobus tenax]|uniref:GIY-YIG nuclease family protein n=1 Tax=Terriglobus tenax TaxID=1111115 RepID=UPI0021E08E85|nr:GIY-YIG nuclease family protein [Terriglobus tenax]